MLPVIAELHLLPTGDEILGVGVLVKGQMGGREPHGQINLVGGAADMSAVMIQLLCQREQRQQKVGIIRGLVLQVGIALIGDAVIFPLKANHVRLDCRLAFSMPHDPSVENIVRSLNQPVPCVYCNHFHDVAAGGFVPVSGPLRPLLSFLRRCIINYFLKLYHRFFRLSMYNF